MATDHSSGWQPAARLLGLLAIMLPLLAACASHPHHGRSAFTSREFGVPVSRRVTNNPNPPHGGGIAMVGQPYVVHGLRYTPKANPVGYNVTGIASYYGWDFHGRLTANGEIFSANAITAGSPDLPLPCYARVTNLENGRSMLVRFNDRGPYMSGRVADLSQRTAQLLGFEGAGTAKVRIQYVGAAPLNGDDTRYLMASLNQSGPAFGAVTRLASVDADQIRPLPVPQPMGGRPATRTAKNPEMRSVLAAVDSLSYANTGDNAADPASAASAVDAMAAGVAMADMNAASDDATDPAISLQLGVFSDPAVARSTAMQFAVLGAVDEDSVTDGDGQSATRLTLSRLKPGVEHQDVVDLVHKLGLSDVVLY
jgi:rare lipoprotein A